MKKIYSKFCLLCRALVLLLLLAVLTPNNLSAQTAGRQIPNYITLNSPFPDSTLTWTAPLGAYKIFKIEIAGDGGDGGAGISIGQTDLEGGKGGDGALISDIPVQIFKEGGVVRDTSILYYDQIAHALIASDSANVDKYFYDEDYTRPVLGTDLCLATPDSTVKLYASPQFPIYYVKANTTDTIGRANLKAAVDALNESQNGGTILVCADDSIADMININKPMTIKAFGGNHTVKLASAFNANMAFFTVYRYNEKLILGENGAEYTLTFDGNRKTPSAAFFYCSNISNGHPSLTIKDGVHITNCSSTVAYVTSGFNLNMEGAVLIDNCTSDHLFYTSFPNMLKMTNGKIENNTVTTCIFEIKGNAQMSGGAIQNNTYTGENASAIISYYSHLDGYTDNSNVKLQDSIFIGDTVRLIAGNNFRVQFETGNELTKHSADNPIIVKVNYAEDRQILTGDAAYILANYTKFKPVDVNGKNVGIDKEGWLREYKFFSVAAGSTDTVGHSTLKAAVDTLNNHGGGKVLADYGEVLTETVNVNSDIQILARGGDVTFTRGESLKKYPMVEIAEGVALSVGSAEDVDTLAFDGGSIEVNNPIMLNKGTLNLLGNIVFRNNNCKKDGGAIVNNDSIYVGGSVLFQNNHTKTNGAGICNKKNVDVDVALFIKGQVRFEGNSADEKGGAIFVKNGKMTVDSDGSVVFENNKSKLGTVFTGTEADVLIQGKTEFHNNIAENGTSIYVNSGTVSVNGYTEIVGDTATQGAIIYNKSNLYFNTGLVTGNVCQNNTDSIINGIISANGSNTYLRGGRIFNNKFDMTSELNYDPYTAVLTSKNAKLSLGDSISIDTVRLYLKEGYSQKINILSDLSAATASNPIVLVVDSLDKKVLSAEDGTFVTANYMKFKPSSDTLTINNKGFVVRKPEISVDGIYLLQAGTQYEDYGITTATGNVDKDKIYVEYTQNVDAHGKNNTVKSDSTILEMNVTNNGNVSNLRQKIAAQENGRYVFEIPFSSDLWDRKPSDGVLATGTYKVEIDTLIVHTLGIAAGTEETLEKNVNIPTFDIDTLNFMLAGTKFSDYDYCGVGNSTNDGDGNDVVPGDEIYVQYTRSGAIDTAYITVEVTGNGQTVTYKENTPANTQFSAGCGSFRSFLDNTGIGQFEPNALQLVDDSTYTCNVNIHVKAVGDPYFAIASKTFSYKHDIDRKAAFALFNTESYNKIGVEMTNINDSLAFHYPSAFSVAKAQELGMIDNTDKCVYVILTADPVDETIRVESANQAIDLLSNAALNSNNYSTDGYGVQDGKLLMAVKVSEPVAENAVVVPAINFALDSVLRWCSAIGANTGVENPYHTFRTYYKLSGETAQDTTVVACNQMSYHKTGVSGVKLQNSNGQASFVYHPEDYTVWAAQDPTPGLNLDGKVWLALYVAAPNENVKQVYSHPATNTPSGEISSIVTLEDNLDNRVTISEAVNYYPVGTCADYANKDYTFYTNDSAYVNNYLYWFDENGKLLSVQHFNAAVKAAPKYTVNFNFNGGGATCNDPYSDTFADTTYVFGRPIVRPDDPFKCGHLFMDWRHGVDSFTVDSFKNVRSGISEATGETVENEAFGIRSNMVLDAAWKYFITIEGLRDTAVVANYSLCEINTRDYVWEPTEDKRPYCYTYHKDYLGHEYRYYIPGKNGNCDVRFGDSVYLESPKILPVGQTPQVTWTVTDMCGTPFTLTQNVNVMFPPCGTDNYDPAESAYDRVNNNHGSLDGEYLASIDGKDDYRTVRIGCNCWLKENLQNENYADGSSIAIAKAYLNDETKVPEFGRLYTWYSAVNVPEGDDNTQPATANETITFSQTSNTYSRDYVQGVCPDGWHIPALAEYQNLKDLVGTANAIKAVGGNYWLGYQDATDAAEFTGVPGGYYDNTTDRYFNILGKAYFWSTENYGVKALPCSLLYGCPEILFNEQNKYYGVSVRCVRNIKISY